MKRFIYIALVAILALASCATARAQYSRPGQMAKEVRFETAANPGVMLIHYDRVAYEGRWLTNADLQQLLPTEDYAQWRRSNNTYKATKIVNGIGAAMVIAGFFGHMFTVAGQMNPEKIGPVSNGLLAAGGACCFLTIPFSWSSLNKMNKVIGGANARRSGSLGLGSTPNGFGLNIAL